MDKKEIYEHLAKIYLDASSGTKRKKKVRAYSKVFRNLFLVSIFFIVGLSIALLANFNRNKALDSEITLVLLADAAKINFHFDPAKKEIYTLNLNKLNLTNFRALGFSVKKADYKDNISLRVEFTSPYKERAEVYFKNIAHKWHDYKINLAEFRGISDWSEMKNLSFIVEEWNVREKRGVVYIDNVRLLK